MVKQYKDGYYINGEWFNGMHSHDPSINAECLGVDVIDGPHLKSIKVDGVVRADHLYYDGDAWCELKYVEPYDTKYITYIFYAIAFLAVLAILFVIFA